MDTIAHLQKLCQLIRFDILNSTTSAGSGHPSSCLSAVELMTTLFFNGHLRYDLKNPHYTYNDRVIFSKGHAAPLLYSLFHVAGAITLDELLTLRTFNSRLEGHPTPIFQYTEVATGSLGQGLSIGAGMAMGIKLKSEARNPKSEINSNFQNSNNQNASNFDIRDSSLKQKLPKVFVLLGDGEMTEGQIWEAMELASCYHLNNLVGILDVNRLELAGSTIHQWDLKSFENKIKAFGWNTITIEDGNDLNQVNKAFNQINQQRSEGGAPAGLSGKPTMIIAKTVKGKGVSFMENTDGWHGKPAPKDQLQQALKELGEVNFNIRGHIKSPQIQKLKVKSQNYNSKLKIEKNYTLPFTTYNLNDKVATREAYGDALVKLGKLNDNILVLDADVRPSTYANKFQKVFPDRFFEMHVAEQNMIGMALGLSKIGYTVFSSTFAAFLTRAFDQIRMAQYSLTKSEARNTKYETNSKFQNSNNQNVSNFDIRDSSLNICGSHAGVSIGEDGPSQMGLEDMAMMRSILNSVVLYPSDAVSTAKLVQLMANQNGLHYIRTTRRKTPVIYKDDEKFEIGGSKVHKLPPTTYKLQAIIIAAGITLHEALKAQKQLAEENINTVVLDCYSIKPIDSTSVNRLIEVTKNVIVVEDHYPAGGLGEAVMQALLANLKFKIKNLKFAHLCVRSTPRSGKPEELLHFEEIDAQAIVKAVKTL